MNLETVNQPRPTLLKFPQQGEQVRYLTDTTLPENVRSWYLEIGVEFLEARENGPFRVSRAENIYCLGGQFDPRAYIDGMSLVFTHSKETGYMATCAVAVK